MYFNKEETIFSAFFCPDRSSSVKCFVALSSCCALQSYRAPRSRTMSGIAFGFPIRYPVTPIATMPSATAPSATGSARAAAATTLGCVSPGICPVIPEVRGAIGFVIWCLRRFLGCEFESSAMLQALTHARAVRLGVRPSGDQRKPIAFLNRSIACTALSARVGSPSSFWNSVRKRSVGMRRMLPSALEALSSA
jgi:hypothetical protein